VIEILCSNGVAAALRQLQPQLTRVAGEPPTLRPNTSNGHARAIKAGASFDLAVLTAPTIEALTVAGHIAAGTAVEFACTGIGVSIIAGAPKPDISTPAAFTRTLLAAQSIAYTIEGQSGIYFAALVQRLGIGPQVTAKAKLRTGGVVSDMVARGEADLAVEQISELLTVTGVQFVGPLPPSLQLHTIFAAATAATAKAPEKAGAIAAFLASPVARYVLQTSGMEPLGKV
jgi:molybdate transport system substrate-binding protein